MMQNNWNIDKSKYTKVKQNDSEEYQKLQQEADERIKRDKREQANALIHIDDYVASYSRTLDNLNNLFDGDAFEGLCNTK